jgi:hypothetical protein
MPLMFYTAGRIAKAQPRVREVERATLRRGPRPPSRAALRDIGGLIVKPMNRCALRPGRSGSKFAQKQALDEYVVNPLGITRRSQR